MGVVEEIVGVKSPLPGVDSFEFKVGSDVYLRGGKRADMCADIIADEIEIGCEQRAAEPECESFSGIGVAAEQFRHVDVIADRDGEVGQVESH